jgi:hypothetical protein
MPRLLGPNVPHPIFEVQVRRLKSTLWPLRADLVSCLRFYSRYRRGGVEVVSRSCRGRVEVVSRSCRGTVTCPNLNFRLWVSSKNPHCIQVFGIPRSLKVKETVYVVSLIIIGDEYCPFCSRRSNVDIFAPKSLSSLGSTQKRDQGQCLGSVAI